MARTVVGLFDDADHAHSAIQELITLGVPRDDISLIARETHDTFDADTDTGFERNAAEGAATGAVGGGVLGGVLGLLLGVGALAIPGVGPLVLAGPIASAIGTAAASTVVGAGVGALSGGLLGALVGAGIPEEVAPYYAEGVQRGGILVSASVDDSLATRAYTVLQEHGAVNMQERVEEWQQTGWEDPATTRESYYGQREIDRERSTAEISGPYSVKHAGSTVEIHGRQSADVSPQAGGDYNTGERRPAGEHYGEREPGTTGALISSSDTGASRPTGEHYGEREVGSSTESPAMSTPERSEPIRSDVSDVEREYHIGTAGEHPAEAETSAATHQAGAAVGPVKHQPHGGGETEQISPLNISGEPVSESWKESDKVGTATGAAAGAVAGAAIGAAGGPIGAALGGLAGAAIGGAVGAGGDIAMERKLPDPDERDQEDVAMSDSDRADTKHVVGETTGEAWEESNKLGTGAGTAAGAAGGAAVGAAGGPAGAVIGAAAGAALGAGLGAAGDIAERREDDDQSDERDDEDLHKRERGAL